MLTSPHQASSYATGFESKIIYWIKTNKKSDDSMSVLYKGEVPQTDQMVMSFSKIMSCEGTLQRITLDFKNNGASIAKLIPNENSSSKKGYYKLWTPEEQIGELDKTRICCADSIINPYFRTEKIYSCCVGLPLIIGSIVFAIITTLIGSLIPELTKYFMYISIASILFAFLSPTFSSTIWPLFSKNRIHRRKSLSIFSLSDNTKVATVCSTKGVCCNYPECLCEIECFRELDQYQFIALISIKMVELCEYQESENSSFCYIHIHNHQ